MSTRLHWRPVLRSDKPYLHQFCCCEAVESTRRNPQRADPWAYEVQGHVRQGHPSRAPKYMLAGWDGAGIGAAVRFRESEEASYFWIQTIAVHNRLRGQRLGDEAMGQVVDAVAQRGLDRGHSAVRIEANVHSGNDSSLKLVTRWGFAFQYEEGDYLRFASDLPLLTE